MVISLVTGASSGLGRAISNILCKKGHQVYVVARSADKLKQLQEQCKKDSGKILPIPGDLTDSKFRINLINTILNKEKQIDYLINNAGFGLFNEFEKEDISKTETMYKLNVIAYSHLIKLVLPNMKKLKSGRIINIASVVAFTPLSYFATYNATKFAVTGLTRSLSYELKNTGVSISAVFPARMKTGFAGRAFDCQKGSKDYDNCVNQFNDAAGSADKVAKFICKKLDSKRLFLFPNLWTRTLYFTRHFPGILDIIIRNKMAPKAKEML